MKNNIKKSIPKSYDFKVNDKKIFDSWLKKKKIKNTNFKLIILKPFDISKNINLDTFLSAIITDIYARFYKTTNKDILFVSGLNYDGINAEEIIKEKYFENLFNINKQDFDKYLDIWIKERKKYFDTYIKKMGIALSDFDLTFSLEEKVNDFIKDIFLKLYKDHIIYKGDNITYWCNQCQTVLSSEEVIYEYVEKDCYYIRFFIKAADKSVVIHTFRPELILGTVSVAVNPLDRRYKDLIGRTLILPIANKEITIIADESLNMNHKNGVYNIISGHSYFGFEMSKKHSLPIFSIIDDNGKLNDNAMNFKGLSIIQARENIIDYLDSIGNLESITKERTQENYCPRCNSKVEKRISNQWFVNMKKLVNSLPSNIVENIEKINIVPNKHKEELIMNSNKLYDWCISKNGLAGNDIPSYVCEDCKEDFVSIKQIKKCKNCKSTKIKKSNYVLDPWFAETLWNLIILDWPKNKNCNKIFQNTFLEASPLVLNFWIFRLLLLNLYLTKHLPITDLIIHPNIYNKYNQLVSKKILNMLDISEMIDKYGADNLKLTLFLNIDLNKNFQLSLSKLEESILYTQELLNRLWNASRFIKLNYNKNIDFNQLEKDILNNINKIDHISLWMLDRLLNIQNKIIQDFNDFNFNIHLRELINFINEDFCNVYIEFIKSNQNNYKYATYILLNIIKILNIFIPFITENIWELFDNKNKMTGNFDNEKLEKLQEKLKISKDITLAFKVIQDIKKMRLRYKLGHNECELQIDFSDDTLKNFFPLIQTITNSKISINQNDQKAFKFFYDNLVMKLIFENFINIEAKLESLNTEIESIKSNITKYEKLLTNNDFLIRSTKKKIKEIKQKLEDDRDLLEKLNRELQIYK